MPGRDGDGNVKVLMLGWELPPRLTGGLGTACEGLLRGLHSLGTTAVTFVVPSLHGGESDTLARLLAANAYPRAPLNQELALSTFRQAWPSLDEMGEASWRPSTLEPPVPAYGAYHGALLAPILDYAARMPALLAGAAFDVIHAHDWLTLPAAAIAKQRTNRPLIAHVHSTEVERAGTRAHRHVLAIEHEGLRLADRIVAVSQATRQVLVTHYGIDPAKVDVVYNAADQVPRITPRQRTIAADPVVVFIGRVTQQKGPHYFIEAACKLRRIWGHAKFVMAGDGDLLPTMKALVQARGLQQCFHFPGFLDAPSVRSWLERADVFIMPSLAEPFGIGALEAVRAGVPVVVSRHAGVAEVIEHLSRVDSGDAQAMADAVARLLASPDEAYRQAVNAQRDEAVWTWRRSAEAIQAIYRLLAAHSPAHAWTSPRSSGLCA